MQKTTDDTVIIVIMLKDKNTGFLEKELLCVKIYEHDELLLNTFAETCEGRIRVVLRFTCTGEISDEIFDDIYDMYDKTVYDGCEIVFNELEDCLNPSWELSFDCGRNENALTEYKIEQKINSLLEIHASQLKLVFDSVNRDR